MRSFYIRVFLLLLLGTHLSCLASAQTDDLMIVEYLDSDPGAGFGITIYNPTSRTIDMSSYRVGTYNNGSTSGTTVSLSGMLAPGGTVTVGNGPYCNACPAGCGTTSSSAGVNGNDAIVLSKSPGTTLVDMVGLYGVDVFSNVGGVRNALLHHHLYREPSNCIRYSSTDGVSPNSWSNTSAVSMTGWRVVSVNDPGESCLRISFVPSSGTQVRLPLDTSLCGGTRLTLTASPSVGLHYLWNTGDTTSTLEVDSSGQYIVTASKDGCTSRDSIQVDFKPLPVVRFPTRDTSMCTGDSILLAVADSVRWQYSWNTSDTTHALVVSDSGTYILTVNRAGCVGVGSIHVALRPLPIFSLGKDTGVCLGDSVQLRISVPVSPGVRYLWSTGDTLPVIHVAGGAFSLQSTRAGCSFRDTVNVAEYPLPTVSLGLDSIVCQGLRISLQAVTNVDTLRYRWNTGDTTSGIRVGKGRYSVQVQTRRGCRDRDTVTVEEELPVEFQIGTDASLCVDSSLVLTPSQSFSNYLWSTGSTSRSLVVASAGQYALTGFSRRGCPSLSPTVSITTIPCDFSIPNVFTPNEDQKNDTWKTKEPFLVQASVKVYNRWGEAVFSSNSPSFEWTGKDNVSGSYFYHIEGTRFDGKAFIQKGWVELAR